MEITNAHVNSLVEKLNSLDLSPEEREVFGRLFGHDDAETEGFNMSYGPQVQGFNLGVVLEKMSVIAMPPKPETRISPPPR